MNWIKSNKFLTGFFAVMLVGIGVLGYFLFSASSAYDAADDNYQTKANEFSRLRHLPLYPNAKNLKALEAWVAESEWAGFLAKAAISRSNTSICLIIKDPAYTALAAEAQEKHAKSIVSLLEKEGAAFDIGAYRDAPAGLRIWGGATVETTDLQALLPWLDWAYAEVKQTF